MYRRSTGTAFGIGRFMYRPNTDQHQQTFALEPLSVLKITPETTTADSSASPPPRPEEPNPEMQQ